MTGDKIAERRMHVPRLAPERASRSPVFNGMHRFLPTLLRLQGYQVVEILVNHRPRTRGKSKYGVGNRLWRGIMDCLAMRWFAPAGSGATGRRAIRAG